MIKTFNFMCFKEILLPKDFIKIGKVICLFINIYVEYTVPIITRNYSKL